MWLTHILHRNRLVRPNAVALAGAARAVTWLDLDVRTEGIAAALSRSGVIKGDRIVILSGNRIEVIELYFACAKLGALACPVNPALALPEVEYIASTLRPVGFFAEREVLNQIGSALEGWRIPIGEERFEEMASDASPLIETSLSLGDPAMIFSTSATSGRPKAVVVSHRSLMASYVGMAGEGNLSHEDILLNPCPLFHGSTVIGLALLAAGGCLVIEREFTPQRFLADVGHFRATLTFLVPSMIHFVLAAKGFEGAHLSSLREVMHGGGPMTQALRNEALARLPCKLRSVYGITEGGGPIAMMASDEAAPIDASTASREDPAVGRAMLGTQIVVLDEAGQRVSPGVMGEICMQGDGMMEGYWEDAQASGKALANGWLHTGDLGYLDRHGLIHLIDRKNDLIIRGGQNIYPAEIERVLRDQPAVADAAAVGVPSVEWGEVPVAFVVARDENPLNTVALIAACTRELASYKRPAAIHLVTEIPRNAAGKMLRRVLRERLKEPASRQGAADAARGA